MKARIKKVTKEKVVLTMSRTEANILYGLLNHATINSINPVLYQIWDKLSEYCVYDVDTFSKTLKVVK